MGKTRSLAITVEGCELPHVYQGTTYSLSQMTMKLKFKANISYCINHKSVIPNSLKAGYWLSIQRTNVQSAGGSNGT